MRARVYVYVCVFVSHAQSERISSILENLIPQNNRYILASISENCERVFSTETFIYNAYRNLSPQLINLSHGQNPENPAEALENQKEQSKKSRI